MNFGYRKEQISRAVFDSRYPREPGYMDVDKRRKLADNWRFHIAIENALRAVGKDHGHDLQIYPNRGQLPTTYGLDTVVEIFNQLYSMVRSEDTRTRNLFRRFGITQRVISAAETRLLGS